MTRVSAEIRKGRQAGPEAERERVGRHGIGTLGFAALAVVAGFSGVLLWLALTAGETMEALRAQADRAGLRAEFILPPRRPAPAVAAETAGQGGGGSSATAAAPAAAAQTPPLRSGPLPVAIPPRMAAPTPTPPTPTPPSPAALPAAPQPELIETTALGPLPRIAADGRQPWQSYARPFDRTDRRPRIAVIVSELGLSAAATEAALQTLPGAVTLAFSPYAHELERWLPLARNGGHETMLMVPMEPVAYPRDDPGPQTLLVALDPDTNNQRLDWVLSRGTGYVGVVNTMGSRFTTAAAALRPVMRNLARRGLLFVDSRIAPRSVAARTAGELGVPRASNDRFIDDVASRDAIDLRLRELEEIARNSSVALGMAYPYPVTVERLVAWAATLEAKGIALAPVTAIANLQPDR